MHKKVYIVFCFFSAIITSAQFHEIGVFLGGSNYIGDVGTDRYLDPNELAYGVIYKWNVTERYSFRGGFTFTTLKENEFNNNEISRFRRSYKVENSLQEFTGGIEINFKEFNLHDPKLSFTPYVFYGLSYFRYDQFYLTPNGPTSPPSYNNFGKDEEIALPLIIGFKVNPNPFFVIGFEIGARYSLTDNLDGSNPQNQFANNLEYKFGNIANNDWYIFTGITFSFTFGDLPCYCKE
ncbi:MAG: DUF6089 family protein [Flavobacteriaceae bacterium]|jgi:hypothetical protein|nr:DUF6089 family protein [Flavobacteriaceae bacterium]|tara:strand:- start:9378 stop:10085 length:708 start_codon:yes stop_codon:yes gene_type:complete